MIVDPRTMFSVQLAKERSESRKSLSRDNSASFRGGYDEFKFTENVPVYETTPLMDRDN